MTTTPPVNIKAAAWTTGIHILLLLLFLVISYSTPASAPVEELGMEVNLGTSDDGSGDDQPMATDAPAAAAASARYRETPGGAADTRETMNSDDPEAPSIASSNRANTRPGRDNQAATQPERPANEAQAPVSQPQRPRYVYSGGTGPGGNNAATNRPGTGEGNTTGPGDRGVPGGTPGAANYTGSPGNGTGGISHTLSGREISPRQFVAEFNEGGKVVVRVKVNRDGQIISKDIKTSPSRKLSEIALQKLAQARFSPRLDAAPEQIGDVTFIFKTRAQ